MMRSRLSCLARSPRPPACDRVPRRPPLTKIMSQVIIEPTRIYKVGRGRRRRTCPSYAQRRTFAKRRRGRSRRRGAQFAYRELGPRAGVPLVLLTHLGENLGNWGPRIVDGLARDRPVITVDYGGAGDSTGTVRSSMEAMAADMVAATGPVLIVCGDGGRMVPPQSAGPPPAHRDRDGVPGLRPRGRLPGPPRVRGRGPGLPAPLTPLRTTTHRTP